MKKYFFYTLCFLCTLLQGQSISPNISTKPQLLNPAEQQVLRKLLQATYSKYDSRAKMLTTVIDGYQYHRDTTSGIYHEIRGSLSYALALLNAGENQYQQQALDIIEKCVSLQDTVKTSQTCGIWGYYLEEPLQTKKSPPDFNMADFNAVTLLDIVLNHKDKLPSALYEKVKNALILKRAICFIGYQFQ